MQDLAGDIKNSLEGAGYGHLDVRVIEFVRKAAGPEAARAPVSGEEPSYLEAPVSIPGLFVIVRNSSALRPNIDAYCVNIDGFGHRIKPRFGDDDVKAAVRAEMLRGKPETPEAELDEAVEARLEKWRGEAAAEKALLERFFEYATVGMSFIECRKRTRFDLEACGNAYWEIARGPKRETEGEDETETSDQGDLLTGKIYHAPAKYMRLFPARDELTVDQREQQDALTWHDAPVRRRFRRFACVAGDGGVDRHLKEFGDPRVMSGKSGAYYESAAAMRAREGDKAEAANEVVHFSIYAGDLGYGQPRWIGAMRDVLGSISVAEVNYLFFEEGGGVPFLAILVSGARMGDGSAEAVEEVLAEHRAKGVKAFRRALVLEAVPVPGAVGVSPKVDVKPLRGESVGDQMYLAYDEKNTEKVGSQFRLPPILRGIIRDINRATAESAISYAESQVFAGERSDFDWFMNRVFLAEAGVKWHDFVSLGPQVHELEGVSASLATLRPYLRPLEARRYLTENTTLDLEELDPEAEPWTLRPLEVTVAGRGFDVTASGEKRGNAPWLKGRHAPRPHEVIAEEEDDDVGK